MTPSRAWRLGQERVHVRAHELERPRLRAADEQPVHARAAVARERAQPRVRAGVERRGRQPGGAVRPAPHRPALRERDFREVCAAKADRGELSARVDDGAAKVGACNVKVDCRVGLMRRLAADDMHKALKPSRLTERSDVNCTTTDGPVPMISGGTVPPW